MSTSVIQERADKPLMQVASLPVEQAVGKLIEYALSIGASDLFFETDDHSVQVQARHLGMVQDVSRVPIELGRKYLAHIRASARMDLGERRRPADGRWIFQPDDGPAVDLRINIMPTIHGEDLAMRLLERESRLLTLERLGLLKHQHQQAVEMLESPSGLILMTGPTGSGKTSTLYACLMRLNTGQRKINTIEDPIEYSLEGLRQSQISPALKLGFSELLRSVLRQSPDVIMIGEIRDAETAEIAVRAANSGHLVLATIHAPTAAGAVQSMRALGVHPHFLSTALRGTISQRLVRTLCPRCRLRFDLTHAPHTFDEVRPWLAPGHGHALHAPGGCETCNMSGYAGREAVFEVMTVSKAIRDLIAGSRPTDEIRVQAVEEKMLEFRQAALIKVALGITSTDEIFRVIPLEEMAGDAVV